MSDKIILFSISLAMAFCFLFANACKEQKQTKEPANNKELTDYLDEIRPYSELPKVVEESSGLLYYNKSIWSLNDSGQGPFLYEMDTTSTQLIRRINVLDATNVDWEDLAQDNTHLYIGDFGNNNGNRKDLVIYSIAKEDIEKTVDNYVYAKAIYFSYPDQQSFMSRKYLHNYDCEAMIARGDSLYIFTKNYLNFETNCYSLPKTPGTYQAQYKASANVKGLVTAAAIDEENQRLCLLGYEIKNGFHPFVYQYYNFLENQFFNGNSKRINLNIEAQTEGLCYWSNGNFLLSQEKEKNPKALTYLFDNKKWMKMKD